MIKISNLDYVIINSGYTARLVKRLAYNNITVIKENTSEDTYNKNGVYRIKHVIKGGNDSDDEKSNEEECDDEESEEEDEIYYSIMDRTELSFKDFDWKEQVDLLINNCMFINDGLWGNGLYKIGDDATIDLILKAQGDTQHRGTICYKCGSLGYAMRIIDVLQKVSYCYGLETGAITEIEYHHENNLKIAIISLDTESG